MNRIMHFSRRFPSSPALIVSCATTMEMRAVFNNTDADLPSEGDVRLTTAFGRPLLLMVSGIGPINAAMNLASLLASCPGMLGVVNLGVAGAFSLDVLPLGSFVLVNEEIWPEFGLLGETGIDPQGIGLAMGKVNGRPVWDRLVLSPADAAERMGLPVGDAPEVASLTVAGVTGTAQRAKALHQHYGAEVENMEGFALAWTCVRHGLPFLEIRTISNLVGSRRDEHWDLQGALRGLAPLGSILFQQQ